MENTYSKFRRLDADKIVETVEALNHRIGERFPNSGLKKVVTELLDVARETVQRTEWIRRPHIPLRGVAAILIVAIIALLILVVTHIKTFQLDDFTNSMQGIDSAIGSVVFIGAAILFCVSWENRIKRRRALKALHELRSLAHIIDMHQLTKDPESYFNTAHNHTTHLRRTMTPFELNRYLDYCSDALACISKIAALYAQGFEDPVLLNAVDDVEDLTAGFSRKIWQKITIMENFGRSLHAAQVAGLGTPPAAIPDKSASQVASRSGDVG